MRCSVGAVHHASPASPGSHQPSRLGHLCFAWHAATPAGSPGQLQRSSSHRQKYPFKRRLYSSNFSSTQQSFPFLCTARLGLPCREGSSTWEWEEMAPAVWQGSFSPCAYFSTASFYLLYLCLKFGPCVVLWVDSSSKDTWCRLAEGAGPFSLCWLCPSVGCREPRGDRGWRVPHQWSCKQRRSPETWPCLGEMPGAEGKSYPFPGRASPTQAAAQP